MLIRDIMSAQPICVSPQALLSEVVDLMTDKGVGFMIVAEGQKAVGVFTEGDFVAMAMHGVDVQTMIARDYMHSPVFSVQADASIFRAYDELVLQKMRHLVVEDEEGALVGVVTMSNFIAHLGVEQFSDLQTVSDILQPITATLPASASLTTAVQMMSEHRHAMIVLDGRKPVGILTSRGITRLCKQPARAWAALTLADVMSPPVVIHRQSFVPEASMSMKEHRTRHLVVVGDCGEFMGLVTISDVAHSMEGRYVEFMRSVIRDMEQNLLSKGSQNRALYERNPNAVFSLDIKGVITHVNPAGILLMGFAHDDLVEKAIVDLYDKDCLSEAMIVFEEAVSGHAQSAHLRMLDHHHHTVHVFISFVPIMTEGVVSGVYAVAFDITERVLAERRLYKLSQALQQAGEPIAITDAYGVMEFANVQMHQLFHYPNGSLVGMNLRKLEQNHAERSVYMEQVWPFVAEGLPYKGEFMHQSKDGANLELQLSCAPVQVPDAKDIDCYVHIYEDLSMRRAMKKSSVQAQGMEGNASLPHGVVHDLNNYLDVIRDELTILQRDCDLLPDVLKRLDTLEKVADRSASLLKRLATFSR